MQDKSHGNHCKLGTSYSCNNRQITGVPNRLRPVSDDFGRVQEDMSSDKPHGVDDIGQNVKLHGKLQGLRHVTRMPIIADPTLGLQKVCLDHIGTDEKVKLLLVEYYPITKVDYDIVGYHEQMATKILKTGMAPALNIDQRR